jgi:hypothetical protein
MKSVFQLLLISLLFACCKEKNPSPQEPVNSIDSSLAGTWKLVSVTNQSGVITTNPTDQEIFTVFQKDTNTIIFENGGSSGGGSYTLLSKNGLKIFIAREDEGGWPNGPWLDLYLENMNKARSYTVTTSELRIVTSERKTLFFTKQ